ncbi:MAG: hypothetical protein JO000_30215 [Alphaproteobacteria bacterium]|nr:hypothetical protein [Alphaproteobacteria bacterium]
MTFSTNKIARVWDLATLQLLARFEGTDLQIALGGERLLSAHSDGSVRIRQLPGTTQELVDTACRLLPAPLTKSERQKYALDPEADHYPCDRRP